MTADEAVFLGVLMKGKTMAEAMEAAFNNTADFDASQAIALSVEAGIAVVFGRPARRQAVI
jgi:hypothetical protein